MKKIFLISILFIVPFITYGAEESRDLLPGIATSTSIAGLVAGLINIMISVGVLLAVIMLSIGGFQYMTQDAGSSKESAKKTITQAVLGVLILLAAWLILFIINPQILDIKFLGTGTEGQVKTTQVPLSNLSGVNNGSNSSRATVDDLETHTITDDLESSAHFWYKENCEPSETREVAKNNPGTKIGIVSTSKPGECKSLNYLDNFVGKERLRTAGKYSCSYTITCVRK